jgi:hypothetical protein
MIPNYVKFFLVSPIGDKSLRASRARTDSGLQQLTEHFSRGAARHRKARSHRDGTDSGMPFVSSVSLATTKDLAAYRRGRRT